MRIIRWAGLTPWPKLFHNLRASWRTELAETFPIHVVCAWVDNAARIAAKHYLQVTDGDFERAAKRRCGQRTATIDRQWPKRRKPRTIRGLYNRWLPLAPEGQLNQCPL
jgi:hypothetical protein